APGCRIPPRSRADRTQRGPPVRRHRSLHCCAVLTVLAHALLFVVPAIAVAQGTGRSMDIDLSIRSAGMAGAATAVSWGDLDHWANPALLGSMTGVRYLHTRTQLVPGLAKDVFLTSDAVQAGAGGFGIVSSGKPGNRGGVFL